MVLRVFIWWTFSVRPPFLGGWSLVALWCYWLQGFWSISFLLSNKYQRISNNWHSSPRSRGFNLKVLTFRELFTDFHQGVSVRWYWYNYKFATPVGMVLDHYMRLVRWHLNIRMYLHIPENCDFFFFGNRLGLVFIPALWDFNAVVLALRHAFWWICATALLCLSS